MQPSPSHPYRKIWDASPIVIAKTGTLLAACLMLLAGTVYTPTPLAGTTGGPDLADDRTASFRRALSQKERDWLAAHPNIRLGVDPAWEPFEFIDSDGQYRGMASDYVSLLNALLGIDMTPEPGLSWSEVIARAEAGEIDVLPCVVVTPQREAG